MNIELDPRQIKIMDYHSNLQSIVTRSQLINGIEQCLNGTMTTKSLKSHPCWHAISDTGRAALSPIIDKWIHEAKGNTGAVTEAGVRAYYGSNCEQSTIMPAKIIL